MDRGAQYEEAKYRVKVSHFTEQGFDINGVIHGGANDGEEFIYYKMMGITNLIGFEPLESAFKLLKENHPDILAYQTALGDFDGTAELQVAYGDGKGSSLLDTNTDHPEVKEHWNQGQDVIVRTEKVEIRKFTTWAENCPEVPLLDFDCLVLDTQGNELDILKHMGKHLRGIKYISVELSETPVYKGEAPASEVVQWLGEAGYTLDSPIYSHNDVFFVRSDIKPESDRAYRGLA